MGFSEFVLGLTLSICQAQFSPSNNFASTTTFSTPFFSPSFALSPLPISLGFPAGFTSQSLFLPTFSTPPKPSKKDQTGTYTPANVPIPPDPTASASLTNLLTSSRDAVIDGKGAKAIRALYDQNSFRSFNMEMSVANKNLMNADPAQEISVHCRLTTDYNTPQAKTFSDFAVGCGYKGSVGSLRVCLDENKRDNKICRKLSFRVDARAFSTKKLNYSAPLIHGMESLFFGGMPVDLSMMSERTAYSLMGSLGMVSPLATHAKLFLNGKYLGLYSFVQAVDEQFTKMNFANDDREGKGGLYKELWFNDVHMEVAKDYHQGGTKQDLPFLEEIMSAVESTPLYGDAPKQFFDRYFDVQSLVDLTAFNTVIGATDDWRQRHNFYVYVRQDRTGKKLVYIPWDYDRLYDEGSSTRGALKGKPWWDIQSSATPLACNQVIRTTQEQAQSMGGSPAKIAWNKDILDQFPADINIPVTCDKMTQLMANALGSRIRQRTREIAGQISLTRIRSMWSTWNNQIQTALEKDPAGPAYPIMLAQQQQLEQHLSRSMQKATSEANQEDGIAAPRSSSLSTASSSVASFTPSFTPVSSFVPKTTSTFPAPSFSSPSFSSTSLSSPSFSSPSFSSSSFSSSASTFAAPSFSSTQTLPTSFRSFSAPAASAGVPWG